MQQAGGVGCASLAASLDAEAWDGEWYKRAFFDDGTPLGSAKNDECQIDSIPQSWAVISGAGDEQRARQAMESVEQRLVRRDDRLMLLFSPPFDRTPLDPGYIKGYLPGIRENGGQYTHAAAWSVVAFAMLGEGDKAVELFNLLSPIHHASRRANLHRYKVEPYAVAADVYSRPPHVGRGGWTWYTGAAGWLYRAGLEWILGFRKQGSALRIDPCIPRDWKRFEIDLPSWRHPLPDHGRESKGSLSRCLPDHPRRSRALEGSAGPVVRRRFGAPGPGAARVDAFRLTCFAFLVSLATTGLDEPGTQTELPSGPTRRGTPFPPFRSARHSGPLLSGSPSKSPTRIASFVLIHCAQRGRVRQ